MTAEHIFAGLAVASFLLLVPVLAWGEWPRKPPPPRRPTVPANRWPPYSEH